MVFCNKCGTENVDKSIFCHKCGTKLENSTVGNEIKTEPKKSIDTPQKTAQYLEMDQKQKKGSVRIQLGLLIIFGGVCGLFLFPILGILILIGGVLLFYFGYDMRRKSLKWKKEHQLETY